MFAPHIVRSAARNPPAARSARRTGDGGCSPGGGWDFATIRIGTAGSAETQSPSRLSPPRGQPEKPGPPPPRDEPRVKKRAASSAITNETVATDPGPRTRTTIGVGEEVTLTSAAGTTKWKTTAGTLSAASGVSVTVTAPDTPQDVTVTAGKAQITFSVIAPTDVLMERYPDTGISHTKDRPDVGMLTTAFLRPDTVNFYNVKHREVDVKAFANGVYKPFDGLGHDASPKTIRMQDVVVAGKGTQSRIQDKVCSGDPGTPAPFDMGSILYVIPYEYQVANGPFHRFTSVVQMCTFTPLDPSQSKADLHAYKAGASALTTLGAATSNPDMCFNPPVGP